MLFQVLTFVIFDVKARKHEEYDKGEILFQACTALDGESPEEIAAKIHELEYAHFPQVIEEYLKRL